MDLDFGLQLFSVRKALQEDVKATLEKVAAIGYKNLELAIHNGENGDFKVGGMSGSEFRKQIDQLDMKTVSCHAMFNDQTNWDKLLNFLEEVDSPTVILPIAFFKNRQDVVQLSHSLNKIGELTKSRGIQLYYHNHFQEFQVFEGEKIFDTMLDNTDKELVKFEFDTYWAVRGGEDPVHWLHKLGNRCDLLHQKDLPASVKQVNFFDIFGMNSEYTLDILYKTQKPEEFAEIGEGILKINAYIEAIRSAGNAKYIFVEQDMTSRDELESIEISYRNIVKLLNKTNA